MAQDALIKLIGIAILVAAVLGAVAYVSNLRSSLREAEDALVLSKEREKTLSTQLLEATLEQEILSTQAKEAEVSRNKIRDELQRTLSKLRRQQPPQECKAAVDWAVDNKGDLSW